MMSSPRFHHFAILLFVFGMSVAVNASAGAVRGQLLRVAPNGGRYPAAGVAVTVFRGDLGRSGAAYTGYDGMYYLYNIPPGNYTLEIWTGAQMPSATYNIIVYNQPMTDIAPIVIR